MSKLRTRYSTGLEPSLISHFIADSRTPEEAEQLKQQQLKEQKEGKGKWHEGLASDSESAVSLVLQVGRVVAISPSHEALERKASFANASL